MARVLKRQMLLEVSARNGKICKTLVRSQLEQCAISGYRVQERLCDTGIVQGKVSRMTSPMRQKGNGFTTRATRRLSLRGEKKRYSSTNHLTRGLGWLFSTWNSTGWLLKTTKNMANHAGDPKLVLIIYILTIYSPVRPPDKVQELHWYPRTSHTFPHMPPVLCCHHGDMVFKCMESPHPWHKCSRSSFGFPNLCTVEKGMTSPQKTWGYAQIKTKEDNKGRLLKSTAGHSKWLG